MTAATCPQCNQSLQRTSSGYRCEHCRQNYSEHLLCPQCGQELERIQGCGAVNYLCRQDGLVSGSKVQYRYQPTE